MPRTALRVLLCNVALLACTAPSALSFSVGRSSSRALSAPARQRTATNGVAGLVAKKGRPDVPINQRGGYEQQMRQQQMYDAMRPQADGMPVFNLFVQTELKNIWFPCGQFAGDANAKQLIDGWIANQLGLGGMAKDSVDRSIATSIFGDADSQKNMVQNIIATYPALKKYKKNLSYGYTITYAPLQEAKMDGTDEVKELTPDMMEGPMDKFKKFFNMGN